MSDEKNNDTFVTHMAGGGAQTGATGGTQYGDVTKLPQCEEQACGKNATYDCEDGKGRCQTCHTMKHSGLASGKSSRECQKKRNIVDINNV
jgi:hypothetical protein